MFIEIGAFEAKSKLSQILQEVKKGKSFTITVRGKPIADLIPSGGAEQKDFKEAVADMQRIAKPIWMNLPWVHPMKIVFMAPLKILGI